MKDKNFLENYRIVKRKVMVGEGNKERILWLFVEEKKKK
jgi:hypothetical protein